MAFFSAFFCPIEALESSNAFCCSVFSFSGCLVFSIFLGCSCCCEDCWATALVFSLLTFSLPQPDSISETAMTPVNRILPSIIFTIPFPFVVQQHNFLLLTIFCLLILLGRTYISHQQSIYYAPIITCIVSRNESVRHQMSYVYLIIESSKYRTNKNCANS